MAGAKTIAVKSYRDLTVWNKAVDAVVECYRLAKMLPKNETYGLISQMQRAAISVPANIAEGHGREHLGDYLHHLSVANGSLMELETHVIIANRLRYLAEEETRALFTLTGEVSRMLAVMTRNLKNRAADPETT